MNVLKTTMEDRSTPKEGPNFVSKMKYNENTSLFMKQYYAMTGFTSKTPTPPLEGEKILCM
jgi:hypothetical protein